LQIFSIEDPIFRYYLNHIDIADVLVPLGLSADTILSTSPEAVTLTPTQTSAPELTRTQLFISYSHKDDVWLDRLLTILNPLTRNQTVSAWWDGQIKPSTKWRAEIDNGLSKAKVAILLVSPDFLASDFIQNEELPYLLA